MYGDMLLDSVWWNCRFKDDCGSLVDGLQRKWPVTLCNKGSVRHVQCFVLFDNQKMLDAIAEGVFHLTGHIAICLSSSVFFYKCKIRSCIAI